MSLQWMLRRSLATSSLSIPFESSLPVDTGDGRMPPGNWSGGARDDCRWSLGGWRSLFRPGTMCQGAAPNGTLTTPLAELTLNKEASEARTVGVALPNYEQSKGLRRTDDVTVVAYQCCLPTQYTHNTIL